MSSADSLRPTGAFWTIIFAIFFGNFMATLSITTINIALPVFMDRFEAPLGTVQWMMSGFMLTTGAIAPVVGFLGDRISYKRLYVLALAGFTAASVLCMFAWNIHLLIAARILQGMFSGVIMPTTMTIIYQVLPKEKQALGIGLWSVSAMLAPAFGPTIGGWLEASYGWQALFAMNAPIGIAAMLAAMRFIPYYRLGGGVKLDLPAFLGVVVGTGSLLTAFSRSSDWGWASWQTLLLLGGGLGILVWFIVRTLRAQAPLLNLQLLRIPRYTCSLILNCTITISLYAGTFLIPIYMQNVQHSTTLHTGLVMLPGTLGMALVSVFVGKLYGRLGPFPLLLGGTLLMLLATWELSRLDLVTGTAFIATWIAVRYIGIAMSNMPVTNAAMSVVPSAYSGQASALLNWVRQGSSALSISIFSTILASRTAAHLQPVSGPAGDMTEGAARELGAIALGIQDVFLIGTVLVAAAIPLTFLLRKPAEAAAELPS
ncbi:DHA2 family efflux MFS transporter permease subunit [Paenibacillus sp. IB182496]|uniref:DHA2 family efflux MFS transporter permease subunit n=1 Tax=Paenibacillus sabuli TaxID=2772509 RepID=A0A927BQI3_9BACL|nr:DHA2 family efflux MFS transporter permease subunit [Paenibacillus sabuli]MBD2843905.1 DHA2 family efflux MFS transporter permease subunit [Paenibacillus sabuli]